MGRVPGREGTVTWEDGRALRGAGHRCGPSLGEAGRPTARPQAGQLCVPGSSGGCSRSTLATGGERKSVDRHAERGCIWATTKRPHIQGGLCINTVYTHMGM